MFYCFIGSLESYFNLPKTSALVTFAGQSPFMYHFLTAFLANMVKEILGFRTVK